MRRKAIADGLTALGHLTRLSLCATLAKAGDEGLLGHELARMTKTSPTLTSHHLKILEHAGLVQKEQRGRTMVHRLDRKRMSRLTAALAKFADASS